jgi:hypothetical protein
MNTVYRNRWFSIVEKNGSIVSVVRNDKKALEESGSMNRIRNWHYAKMKEIYPEIEHPVLARYLSGCNHKMTRYVIPQI